MLGLAILEDQIMSLADGKKHVISVTGQIGDQAEAYKIKFNAELNDSGEVESFEIFACQESAQTEYISMSLTGSTFTMLSKGVSEPDNEDFNEVIYQTDVTGTVDLSNHLTNSKTISVRYQNEFADRSFNHVESTLEQTASEVTYNGDTCSKPDADDPCDASREL